LLGLGLGLGAGTQAHQFSSGVFRETMLRLLAILLVLIVLAPAGGMAQSPKQKQDTVPKAYLPPAGMCRIWVDNVPAARQPAPTDCSTAIRNRPPNARVIFPADKKGRSAQPKTLVPNRPRTDTTKRKPPA